MALVPPGKTLKTRISNQMMMMWNKIDLLSDPQKYEACESQLRTVQKSLREWRTLIVVSPRDDNHLKIFNTAVEKNNLFMSELKKCNAANKYENVRKVLGNIFTWRISLANQSTSLRVPGPAYDLSDLVKGSDPPRTMEKLVFPPPAPAPAPAPVPAQPFHQAANPSVSASSGNVTYPPGWGAGEDMPGWYPQQQLAPPPPRKTSSTNRAVDTDASSVSSMQGGLSGAHGSVLTPGWPSGGAHAASGSGAVDSASLKSFATSAFGPRSKDSYSGGSGGGYRTSTDSSGSASRYHSAPQSLDSHMAHGVGGSALPPSGASHLRSGLHSAALPSISSGLSHTMGSMHISSPHQGGPPPPQTVANPASAMGLNHPGQQFAGPAPMTHAPHAAHAMQFAHAGVPGVGLQQSHASAPQPSTIPAAPPMVNPLQHMQHRATMTQAVQSSQTQASARRSAQWENNINSRAPRA